MSEMGSRWNGELGNEQVIIHDTMLTATDKGIIYMDGGNHMYVGYKDIGYSKADPDISYGSLVFGSIAGVACLWFGWIIAGLIVFALSALFWRYIRSPYLYISRGDNSEIINAPFNIAEGVDKLIKEKMSKNSIVF